MKVTQRIEKNKNWVTKSQEIQNKNEPIEKIKATEKQKAYLEKLDYQGDYNLTKGEARKLISEMKGASQSYDY